MPASPTERCIKLHPTCAGHGLEVGAARASADMDADGDVEVFDTRYFMLGYTALADP